MSFPRPIKQEVEEIIDLSLREEALCIWDRNVRKRLFRDFRLEQFLNLDSLMKEYVKSLEEKSSSFEDHNELCLKIRSHMHNFYLVQVWYKFCSPDTYLDNMEDILKEYCELEVVMYNSIQKKAPRINNVLNSEIKMRCNRILNLCNLYLLSRLDRVLHVFIKVIINPRAKPCKEIWAEMYGKFLKNQPIDISDEAFCRAYIIYQRYKEFVDEKEQRVLLEMLYCHYERTPETIERNSLLKKILKPQTNSTLKANSHLAGQLIQIGNQYFEHMRNKSKFDFSEEITDECCQELKNDESLENIFAHSEISSFRPGEVIEIPDDEPDAVAFVISDDDSDVEIVTPCSRTVDEISTFLVSLEVEKPAEQATTKVNSPENEVPSSVKNPNTSKYFHSQPTPPTEEHSINISDVDTVYAPQAAYKCHEDLTFSGNEKTSENTSTSILLNTKKKGQSCDSDQVCEQFYSDMESVCEDIDIEEHHLTNSSVCRSQDFPNGKFAGLLYGESVNGKVKAPLVPNEFDKFQGTILSSKSLTPNEDLSVEDVRPHFDSPMVYSRLAHKDMDKVRGFLCHNSESDRKWMVDAYNCPMKNMLAVRKKEEEIKRIKRVMRTLKQLIARKNLKLVPILRKQGNDLSFKSCNDSTNLITSPSEVESNPDDSITVDCPTCNSNPDDSQMYDNYPTSDVINNPIPDYSDIIGPISDPYYNYPSSEVISNEMPNDSGIIDPISDSCDNYPTSEVILRDSIPEIANTGGCPALAEFVKGFVQQEIIDSEFTYNDSQQNRDIEEMQILPLEEQFTDFAPSNFIIDEEVPKNMTMSTLEYPASQIPFLIVQSTSGYCPPIQKPITSLNTFMTKPQYMSTFINNYSDIKCTGQTPNLYLNTDPMRSYHSPIPPKMDFTPPLDQSSDCSSFPNIDVAFKLLDNDINQNLSDKPVPSQPNLLSNSSNFYYNNKLEEEAKSYVENHTVLPFKKRKVAITNHVTRDRSECFPGKSMKMMSIAECLPPP